MLGDSLCIESLYSQYSDMYWKKSGPAIYEEAKIISKISSYFISYEESNLL